MIGCVFAMKYIRRLTILIVTFFIISVFSYPMVIAKEKEVKGLNLTEEEKNYLIENKDKTFTVGMLPILGTEYFQFNGMKNGFMEPLIKKMNSDLGVSLKLEVSDNWNDIYSRFLNNTIDIIYGANETSERQEFMSFTKPILKNPYVIIAKKDGSIRTIGDIDKKKVGFIENDFVIKYLPNQYKNIKYDKSLFPSNEYGINALRNNEIDAFITTGGPFIYDYLYKYPELEYVFKINTVTSDMTLSSKKENRILIDILNKEIMKLEDTDLPQIINNAEVDYNLKIMNLTEDEKSWLFNDGTAIVGVTKDYLPFDYFDNGKLKGIDGEILNEISRMTGIKFSYDYDKFDTLQEKLGKNEVNLLNIAKTEENMKNAIFTEPFIKERDIIVGRKEADDVIDIFGLEGKSVAVIKGFWHKELLDKNLTNVKIVETSDIQESMKLVYEGKVDYLIENPTVVRYYVKDLQYYDLIQKGITSTDSFFYFGASKNKPELASIINKVLPMIDINELSLKGYQEVPYESYNQKHFVINFVIIFLIVALIIFIIYAVKLIKSLIKEKTEKQLLREREHLLSIDILTELYNRNYFNTKVLDHLDELIFPQVLIIADLNNLKVVNDTFGHHAGDLMLRAFSEALKEACPEDSGIFRIGGDEFFIFLTASSEKEASKVIKKINSVAKDKKIELSEDVKISVSSALGYSIRYSKDITFEMLYKKADMEMYNCKKKMKELDDKTMSEEKKFS